MAEKKARVIELDGERFKLTPVRTPGRPRKEWTKARVCALIPKGWTSEQLGELADYIRSLGQSPSPPPPSAGESEC